MYCNQLHENFQIWPTKLFKQEFIIIRFFIFVKRLPFADLNLELLFSTQVVFSLHQYQQQPAVQATTGIGE